MKTKIALITLVCLTGCATITRGRHEALIIETEPGGATATLSSGETCTTPCSLLLIRKNDVHVQLAKEGFVSVQTDVRSQISGAGAAGMAGNVLVGGGIGVIVDAMSGATKKFVPNPLHVKLEPIVSGVK